jgi:hemerythrin superfamily protein
MAVDQRGPGVESRGRSVRVVGESAGAPAGFEVARAVADAVLYEGYLLYPYRRSSGKNRVRWQFGVLVPRPWLEASGIPDASVANSADAWHQQTDCLLEAVDTAMVHVWLRFLQLQHRLVESRGPGGSFHLVDVLDVDGQRYLTFDEAVPREFHVVAEVGELRRAPYTVGIEVPGGEDIEVLRHGEAGRVVGQRWPVSATVWLSVTIVDTPFRLLRLWLVTGNTADSVAVGVSRSEVLRTSLVATHSVLGVRSGSFVSLLDPAVWAAEAAKNCRNVHTFPVLAGDPDRQDVMLSSPILMYDHPQISPESPGDLFDATEIDEILSLRTFTLTDQEKREARATDPHAAAIIDRVDTLPREVLERLHGAVRSLRPVATGCDGAGGVIADEPPAPTEARREPGADASVPPKTSAVIIDGIKVTKGSRVRLHRASATPRCTTCSSRAARRWSRPLSPTSRVPSTSRSPLKTTRAPTCSSGTAAFTTSPLTRRSRWMGARRNQPDGREDPMDAIELLCHDHRMVEQLFRDYRAAATDGQRRGVVEIIVRELSKHAALEELVFYPLAREVLPDGRKEIDEHLAEHLSVKKTLLALDGLSAGDDRTDALMADLQRDVEAHVQEEEGELMPRLRGVCDEQALQELGQELDKGKRTAPTRPHPAAPDKPPLLTVAAPVAAIYDRMRDRLQGKPQT